MVTPEDRLRAGYDPEAENPSWSPQWISPRRSDAWCAALGWIDLLAEEATTQKAPTVG